MYTLGTALLVVCCVSVFVATLIGAITTGHWGLLAFTLVPLVWLLIKYLLREEREDFRKVFGFWPSRLDSPKRGKEEEKVRKVVDDASRELREEEIGFGEYCHGRPFAMLTDFGGVTRARENRDRIYNLAKRFGYYKKRD